MKTSSVLTSKGQVTIPQEIRIRLGLREGERVEFVAEDDVVIIRPARVMENPFMKYAGILGTFPGGLLETKSWISELRDED